MNKIKLVVSDIDGTLVKDSNPDIYPEMIMAIKELKKKGILFGIASGRQYYSIRAMFREVSDDIIYLCENGAHVVYRGENLHIKEMKDDFTRQLLNDLRTYGEGYDYVISTANGSYLETRNKAFEALIRDGYHNKYELTKDFLALEIPSIKMAIYHKDSIRELGETELIPKWSPYLKTCMAGEEWVDFMDPSVDKGDALRFLQRYFHVDAKETMAFGDNSNDIGLMEAAGESYAVANAREEVKEKARYLCPSYHEKGVYQVIRERLL
ncbi:MAG TPA: HAD family hydrolase [Lachnospiraceae bacterium]|nr:HAD family hydrolase [Lachnospiraceae bacterium]HPF29796.1 HAD family hydrolase [Lachnospiraceae bacterium]